MHTLSKYEIASWEFFCGGDQDIKEAMRKNPKGVFIVENRDESNGPRLAGYLQCKSTESLRRFLNSAYIFYKHDL